MAATIIAKINDNKLSVEYDYLTSGNIGTVTCEFHFDESWDDFTKKVKFYQSPTNYKEVELEGNTCFLPANASAAVLPLFLGVYGVVMDGETVTFRKTTNYIRLVIKEGAIPD